MDGGGLRPASEMVACARCSTGVPEGAVFCPGCGGPLPVEALPQPGRPPFFWLRVLGVLVLAAGALSLGLVGTLLVLYATEEHGLVAPGLLALAGAGAALVGMVALLFSAARGRDSGRARSGAEGRDLPGSEPPGGPARGERRPVPVGRLLGALILAGLGLALLAAGSGSVLLGLEMPDPWFHLGFGCLLLLGAVAALGGLVALIVSAARRA